MTLKSKLVEVLEKKRPQKMPLPQLFAFLKGQGVKEAELAFIGKLDQTQFMVGNNVDSAALLATYQEEEKIHGIQFTLLRSDAYFRYPHDLIVSRGEPQYTSDNLRIQGGASYFELVGQLPFRVPSNHGHHFSGIRSVVGWVRGQVLNDYLFIDEIQTGDYYKQKYIKGDEKPDATIPFLDYSDLCRLMLKLCMQLGLANNLKGVAWINGAQQAARSHSLLTMVGEITVKKAPKGAYIIVHQRGKTEVPTKQALADHIGAPQAEAAIDALSKPPRPLPKTLRLSQTGPRVLTKAQGKKLLDLYNTLVEEFQAAVGEFDPEKWEKLAAADQEVSGYVHQFHPSRRTKGTSFDLPACLPLDTWVSQMLLVFPDGNPNITALVKTVEEAKQMWAVTDPEDRVLGIGLSRETAKTHARKALGLDPEEGITLRLDEPRFISTKAYMTMYDTILPKVAQKLIAPYHGSVQVVLQSALAEAPGGKLPNLGFNFTPEMKRGVEFFLYNPRRAFKRRAKRG